MNKNNSRRKLLKSVIAGSGVIVAGKTLPESWSKPVIDSVVLPAHASTTDTTDSEGSEVTTLPPCPSSLVIPGDTIRCGEGEVIRHRNFYVDDTGRCPELIEITGEFAPSPAHSLNVRVYKLNQDVTASLGTQGNKPESLDQSCGEPITSSPTASSKEFVALSGAKWTASFTLSSTSSSPIQASISDIILTPGTGGGS